MDTEKPQPIHGGSVVLVDEDLNVVSLRMYNEAANPDEYSVSVMEAIHSGEPSSPFYHRVLNLVNPSQDPWRTFSSIVASEVTVRAQNLRARINEKRIGSNS